MFILEVLFVYILIYRLFVKPFMEGYRTNERRYNQQKGSRIFPKASSKIHPSEIEESSKPIVLDAEFTEIPTTEKAD